MTTQNTIPETNILRQLALMQHNGEDFFIFNGIAYTGNHVELNKEWIEATENLPNAQTWMEFIDDNCEEVAELDPEDYNNDYLVLTNEEAEEKWEESLDGYIEECNTPELDKLDTLGNLQYYVSFDEEKWKRDARMDGRGHSLSSYDGNENEETVNGETFYIYRIN